MSKRKKQEPPSHAPQVTAIDPLGLHILDKFTSRDLDVWNAASKDIDQLQSILYFGVRPTRMRKKDELIAALNKGQHKPFAFSDWHRIVDYKYSNAPLSVVGSIKSYGGRFNIGKDVDQSIHRPFPALYLGDNYQTAYRERYQISSQDSSASGLTPEEMSLCKSATTVRVNGNIERILDISNLITLGPFCSVIAKIKMPPMAIKLAQKLKAGHRDVYMIKTPLQLSKALQDQNWRAAPVQFGIPSISQQFSELAREAGYEGILYRSTKNPNGRCLALFSDSIGSDRTFVELADAAPPSVKYKRLDLSTADYLARD